MNLIRMQIQDAFRTCVNILLISVRLDDGKPIIYALPTSLASMTIIESKSQIATATKNETESQQMLYLYEGDIMLTPIQAKEILESRGKRLTLRRKRHANLTMLWNLPIHYRFDGTHSSEDEMLIRHALRYWEIQTCIRFFEVQAYSNISNTNNVTVVFRKSDMCWSFIGRNEFQPTYEQTVAVSTQCLYDGSILHELGHLIGFWHEHQRPDRDDYIAIFKHNIKPRQEFSFFAQTWKTIGYKSVPYDVGSVMQYSETAFSIGDQPTIIPLNYLVSRALGQRFGLSFYDAKQANLGYCKNSCQSSTHLPACLHEGYQDPNDCSKCRCPEGLSGLFCEEAAPAYNPFQNQISVIKRKSFPTWIDSLDCGGTFTLPLKKPFEFGISTYKYLRKCNWLFKAPIGTNIEFVLSDTFLNYKHCTSDPKYPCRDFVEVKYNHSLAATGARLCCSNNMTSHPITSQGNEMLVLFRAYGNGDIGFNATVFSRPCGGCYSTDDQPTMPCRRRVNFTCESIWKEKNWKACKHGRLNKDCGLNVNDITSRPSTCYRDELYCCVGYVLLGNKCIAVDIRVI